MTRRLVLVVFVTLAFSGVAQFSGLDGPAKGFKLILDFYSTPSGAQKKKTLLTAAEGYVLSGDTVFLVNPRLEHFREDGSIDGVATATDALLNRGTQSVEGTNLVSFHDAETNIFIAGRGFLWQKTNAVLIISNQTYTWISKTVLTNGSSKK
jgi:hypothetical protein